MGTIPKDREQAMIMRIRLWKEKIREPEIRKDPIKQLQLHGKMVENCLRMLGRMHDNQYNTLSKDEIIKEMFGK